MAALNLAEHVHLTSSIQIVHKFKYVRIAPNNQEPQTNISLLFAHNNIAYYINAGIYFIVFPQPNTTTLDTQYFVNRLMPYLDYTIVLYAYNQYTVAFRPIFYKPEFGGIVLSPLGGSNPYSISTTEGGKHTIFWHCLCMDGFYVLF